MFVERAEFPVISDRTTEFVTVMKSEGKAVLTAAPSCISVRFGRGVETPDVFILLIEWDSVESHIAFTKTSSFDTFKVLAGPFFAGPSNMAHFEPL